MRKTVSFKLFFTVVWRGFCQVMKGLAKLFGYQGKDAYIRTVWRITLGCLCTVAFVFTSLIMYAFIKEVVMDEFYEWVAYKTSNDYSDTKRLSDDIYFQTKWSNGKSEIVNINTGEVLIKGVDKVFLSSDDDSLAVFFKDDKRGFLNRFTGKVAIEAKYTKAWVFSEGLAAVEENGELKFIDHNGNIVISKGFEVYRGDDEYLFHNGYCLITDPKSELRGFIDTLGNWILEPQFDCCIRTDGFIRVSKDNLDGVYSADLKELFPVEYSHIFISDYDKTIEVRKGFDAPKLYDYNLNLLEDFVIAEVDNMKYYTGKTIVTVDEYGDEIAQKECIIANCLKYRVGNYNTCRLGLMSKSGKRLTPPIYTNIEPIGPDRYLCSPHGVVINGEGRPVE